MKRLLLFLPLLLLTACQDEQGAELANEATFLRYFGSEYSHTPQVALEDKDNDGFILLSTIDIPTDIIGVFQNKIKLTKTDRYGNLVWEQVYPSFEDVALDSKSWRASSMIITDNHYVIVGEEADMTSLSSPRNLALLEIDFDGALNRSTAISGEDTNLPTSSIVGKGVVKKEPSGNYLVLGSLSNTDNDPSNDVNNMMLTELSAVDFSPVWTRFYGDGTGSLTNRLLLSQNSDLILAGTKFSSSSQDVRLLGFPQDNQASVISASNTPNTVEEIASDVTQVFGGFPGYAIIGTTNQNIGEDIYLIKFTSTGEEDSAPLVIDFDGQNDKGVSVSGTTDGGLILLGNGQSSNSRGFGGSDLFVIRLDHTGTQEWQKNYGGSSKEEGASIRQTSDGGYLVFGSTEFGTNFKKLVLLKIDKNGDLK